MYRDGSYPSGMGQKVRPNRLDIALRGTGERGEDFVVFLGAPPLGESWQRDIDDLSSGHCLSQIVLSDVERGVDEKDQQKSQS